MFRSTAFDKLLDKATSHMLMEPDWPSNLQICDLIRQNDVTPRNALAALKKKLHSSNPHTAMYAVQLLESMVKNCGSALHDELATSAYCDALHELVKSTAHENVRQKMLELIQAWTYAFRKNAKHAPLKDTMNMMKAEGFKFPALRESDAMFAADSAPAWADGEVCHRCRVAFALMLRKHHCRACGQVFCSHCSAKTSTLPKFGIEKEVRVCDACFDKVNRPAAAAATAAAATAAPAPTKDPELEEYLKSSLAQQNQAPPRKTEVEMREEEELQLAIALSQSEAEAKEKEKLRATSAYRSQPQEAAAAATAVAVAHKPVARSPSPDNPELARYLNRDYWENRPEYTPATATSPSAPAPAHAHENGGVVADVELEEFLGTLKSQVEIFINRMKSNSSRGRSIANDSSVQTLFMNITAMHSKLLKYIQLHDDSRLHYERLQDKLAQVKDARAALDALREEHRERLRRQAAAAERQRQMLMAHKLEIMRKKKQEYLQYQRQLALQRIQEQEREMQMRQEQQKQQYMMHAHAAIHPMIGHNEYHAPPPASYAPYPSPMAAYAPPPPMPMHAMPPPMASHAPQVPMGPPPPPATGLGQAPPQPMAMMPPAMMGNAPQQMPQQPAAPPPSAQQVKDEPTTAELISFD